MLDLHCHTTYSDGTLTPTQLVERAVQTGVKALAITDHDTVSGWPEAIQAATERGVEIVPGVELSTLHLGRSLHILGFYPNPDHLAPVLQDILQGRQRRAEAMVAKLAELGCAIELPQFGSGMAASRPHLAHALVQAGYAKSVPEAFDLWLNDRGPAYVPYETVRAQEGIALLRECGAVPVWAHPYLFRGGTVETVLPDLIEAGLMGLEVYHPSHSSSQTRTLERLCHQHGLLLTGGSDYHGPLPGSPARHAVDLNHLALPLSLLSPLKPFDCWR